MANLWLKMKIWFKIILALALLLFAMMFIWGNSGESVNVWLSPWNSLHTSVLKLLFFTVIFSVVATILVGTAFRTIHQVRELKTRNHQAQMEKDIAEMKAKADRLQTKPADPTPQ